MVDLSERIQEGNSLGNSGVGNEDLIPFHHCHRRKRQKQPPEVFCKKAFLKNFAKFTGKHLCQSFFFNKVQVQLFFCKFCEILRTPFLENSSGGCF